MNFKTVISAALALTALGAQAESELSYGALAEDNVHGTYDYRMPPQVTEGPLSTNGLLSARAGNVSASVIATADPVRGMFKVRSNVSMQGEQNVNIASGYASLQLRDTLSFAGGANGTVHVEFLLNYDTVFSGLGFAQFPRVNQISHFQQLSSDRSLSLSYDIANPNYDPNASCTDFGSDGVFCPPETRQTITVERNVGKSLFREVALGGPNGIYTNGDEDNGHYQGVLTLSADLPTNTEIRLNYSAHSNAYCFHLANCELTTDASHSDYLGLRLAQGDGFTSDSGYQYQGLAAAVPEPGTWAMMILGLLAVGLGVNQRRPRD